MIGDGADFIEHVRQNYCRTSVTLIKERQDARSRDNIKKIEELMRKRKHGLTLGEKITTHLEKIKKKEVISIIGDSFYDRAEEQGCLFYLRRTNLQRDDGRTLNIVDEIEVEEEKQREAAEIEAKKDMAYETFLEQFTAHIEGTASNEREAHESADENVEEHKKSKPGTSSKKGTEGGLGRNSSHYVNDNDSVENEKRSILSKNTKKSSMNNSKYGSVTALNKTADQGFKYEIPPSCMVSMMKKVLIEKMSGKFFLASHPYPKIEGEMIIFKPKKGDQTQGKDVIVYRDFSLRKRIETVAKPNALENAMSKKTSKAGKKTDEKEKAE